MDGRRNQPARCYRPISLGPLIVQTINNVTPLGIASLSCMDLVTYMSKNSVITMQEINTVEDALQAPMAHFEDLREHLGIMAKNFQYLAQQKHVIPPLSQLRYLENSLRSFTQFSSAIATWKEKNNDINSRTFDSLQAYLLDQIGNIPTEGFTRGGNAFNARGRGKGKKGKGPGKGRGPGDNPQHGGGSYHQGYRAAMQDLVERKRMRSPSPEIDLTGDRTAHPATAFRVTGLDDNADTHSVRSSKSHKSTHSISSTNLHGWHAAPQAAPVGVTALHKYCHWHGYNFSHLSRDCMRLQRDPAGNADRIAATKPSDAPKGSSRVQLEDRPPQRPAAQRPAAPTDNHRNGWE